MENEINVQGTGQQPENIVFVNASGKEVLRLEKKEIELLFTALDKLPVQGLQAANFVLSVAAKLQISLQEPPKPPPPLPQEIKHKQG